MDFIVLLAQITDSLAGIAPKIGRGG